MTNENLSPDEIDDPVIDTSTVEDVVADDASDEEPATIAVTQQPVDAVMLQRIIEGAILASGQPMTVARLLELFDEAVAPSKEDIVAALQDIEAACRDRGYELKEVASGWRFQVRSELAPWVNRLWDEKPQKYSRALLETLALVAYRQPITRGDIEEIRGVAVSSHIMKTLMERDWVKVVGHRDVPGRPSLYATTRQFLDYFNVRSLEDLPSLSELRDLDELNNVLNLGDEEGLGEKDTDDIQPQPVDESVLSDNGPEQEMEEFIDGEEAFEVIDDAESTFATNRNHALPETDAEADAAAAQDTDEERNNA